MCDDKKYKMNSKDIQDVIKVIRLAKNEDIDMIIEDIQEYRGACL